MITLMVLGIAIAVLGVLFAANARRRQNRFAASGDYAPVPWFDASSGGGSSDCDAGATSDAGCSDGGGGGGGD